MILSTTGKAGADHTETHIEGAAGDVLHALTSSVHGVICSLAESGVNPFEAAMLTTEAVKNGISAGIKSIAKGQAKPDDK